MAKYYKYKCTYNHSDYGGSYKEETEKWYFKDRLDLHDVICTSCEDLSGDKDEEGVAVPSFKCLVYVCLGRTKDMFLHVLCNA